ncbi:DUF3566 domain-containing protein [Saccharopolyspora sp. TS4A08]|uniref:DUF3566 domain-containing protein n=1 Tax=Saccharopolyspora ipomoeae TaxID=3042027 RepID=A0ABT6PXB5_9PSEU|nr:DUF3566 domain-containing protein [Saccharopolyspora sp. TS4A08]MDI2032638.1 DUF3566 domain-containing protein [Saccharopolyspora sp. TS4A08]
MTSSEKPESSDPQQDAGRTSVSTQTVDDKVSTTGSEAAASADGTEESGSTAEPTTADSGAGGRADELDGTDSPPPWQRGTATAADDSDGGAESSSLSGSLAAGALGGTAGAAASSNSGVEDTQTIPKAVTDQETVRTQVPQSSRTQVSYTGAGAGAGAGTQQRSTPGTSARRPSRGPRRASLQVKRLDPWSVLKLALVLSVALFFVWMIAVAVLYGVLDGMGVWDQLNGTFTELTQPDDAVNEPLISAGRVFGVASIIGAINIVLITALATVAAFIYNVAADFAGGIEITLSERE